MNRIHKTFIVKTKKPDIKILYKPVIINQGNGFTETDNDSNTINIIKNRDIMNIINIIENKEEISDNNKEENKEEMLENDDEFKLKMAEDIASLKQKVEFLSVNNNVEDINFFLQLVENLGLQLDGYKKMTNERIEKIINIFLTLNSKIEILKKDDSIKLDKQDDIII